MRSTSPALWSRLASCSALCQEELNLVEEGGQSPQTLRALAQAVDRVPAEEQQKILRLLLLNLAQLIMRN